MEPVFQVANALQVVLTTVANHLAKSTGVIQRERAFNGASLAQTFVLGWLNNPRATLEELAQMAAACGSPVTAQSIFERLNGKLAHFFRELFEAATAQVIAARGVTIELLQRFNGVHLLDSTVIRLPDAFAALFPGCGGGNGIQTHAAVKFQVRMNLTDGRIDGPFAEAGKASDQSSCVQHLPLLAGALRIADLGYFSLRVLADLAASCVFWISRIQVQTTVLDTQGKRLDLYRWLTHQPTSWVDRPILLGAEERLPCRLLAVRCPPEIVRRRLAALQKDAKRRCRPLSKAQRQSCHWTILVTNVPQDRLTIREAIVLYRARWQIELLFKLWKQQGLVDESHYGREEAKLAEMYAKFIGLIIQHWLLLISVWAHADRSLVKASQAIRKHVVLLVAALQTRTTFVVAIEQIQQTLAVAARVDPRRTRPNTHQLLENPELLDYDIP